MFAISFGPKKLLNKQNRLQIQKFFNGQCWILRAVYDTTIYLFSLSLLFMGFERVVATLAVTSYEQNEPNIVALILVIVQVHTVFETIFMLFTEYEREEDKSD